MSQQLLHGEHSSRHATEAAHTSLLDNEGATDAKSRIKWMEDYDLAAGNDKKRRRYTLQGPPGKGNKASTGGTACESEERL